MPDTNCFRYRSYIVKKMEDGEVENDEQALKRAYKQGGTEYLRTQTTNVQRY